MNKIEQLIQELCPNGVEFEVIDKIFDIRIGYTPSKKNLEFWDDGSFSWFTLKDIRSSGNILDDSIEHVNKCSVKKSYVKRNSIILATPATVGVHALVTVDAIANQQFSVFLVKDNYADKLIPKFIYYYFFKIDESCKNITKKSAFPSVRIDLLKKLKFPIPPIEVQQKIVTILDSFTELTTELTKRKEQYCFYFDLLFSDQYKKIGDKIIPILFQT